MEQASSSRCICRPHVASASPGRGRLLLRVDEAIVSGRAVSPVLESTAVIASLGAGWGCRSLIAMRERHLGGAPGQKRLLGHRPRAHGLPRALPLTAEAVRMTL